MRVIFTDHVADDARAFLEAARGVEPELPHGVEQAAVNRLQPVAHIGERALRDGGERIGEVALFKRILQLDRLDRRRSENRIVRHGREVTGPALGLKGAAGLIAKESLACLAIIRALAWIALFN